MRIGALDGARADREAYEAVLARGLDKVDAATRSRYNALMITLKTQHG